MQERMQKYVDDDEGAVTIDWVVITGFIVALTLSVATALSPGLQSRGSQMLTPVNIATTF